MPDTTFSSRKENLDSILDQLAQSDDPLVSAWAAALQEGETADMVSAVSKEAKS